tara:strand:- start:1486 stop:1713 length:228 start_codon:yes stop_codon:yes gene_type:complete
MKNTERLQLEIRELEAQALLINSGYTVQWSGSKIQLDEVYDRIAKVERQLQREQDRQKNIDHLDACFPGAGKIFE